jgi:hypothetical protein
MKATKQIKELLVILNSSNGYFKYPIGNKELTETVKLLESQNLIKFCNLTNKWRGK